EEVLMRSPSSDSGPQPPVPMTRQPSARRHGGQTPANSSSSLVRELDRLAPGLISAGRPARLLERAAELAELDVAGHPWAQLLVPCVRWDAAPGHAAAWCQARAARAVFRKEDERRGEAFACFVLGCWTLTLAGSAKRDACSAARASWPAGT